MKVATQIEHSAYERFLSSKQKRLEAKGFDASALNPMLFDFQKWIVKTALQKGCYAIFADCGLGKTPMQLEWAHQVSRHTGKPVIILAPLAVSGQTVQEGVKFGYEVFRGANSDGAGIINYENIDSLNPGNYGGIALDESSILKNFNGVYRNKLVERFNSTPFKLCLTATPSPNDVMELGNHAEFLNVMSRNEMLAMYFIHDGGDTSKWRLKKHAEKAFWRWVSTWACMLTKPSDIGFSDEGYDLPGLNFIERQIITPKRDNGGLFNTITVNATNFNQELRLTRIERLEEAADIVNGSDENFIVWIKQNEEGDAIKKLIPDAVEVRGSDSVEMKENRLLGFADNQFRVLVTKAKIAQFGLNYQNCSNQIFASLDFSFESLYQAVRRSYRFGQTRPVNIYIITTDTMQNVVESIKQKQKEFEKMQRHMSEAMNHSVASCAAKESTFRVSGFRSDHADIFHGDAVKLIKRIPSDSVGFSIFSPPFADLYTYSDDPADMGNSKDYTEFLTAFNFLVPELYRVMWDGRNVAVHCMDLPIQKGKEGYIGLRDFSGMIRESFESAGFIYHSRVTIWKDPVTEMQRTKALGLLHKQVRKDSAMSRVGLPDYLMIFRKDGQHNHPVHCPIDVNTWQEYASPVWYGINYSNTLNKAQGRDEKDEKHICPLQLETIERAIHLWSNEGDTVLTPFGGIMSEVYQAVKMKRRGIGFEIKQSYFNAGIKNVEAAEMSLKQRDLFEAAA